MDISLISFKLEDFVHRVGRTGARTPLLLYYVLQSKDTSTKDKAIIATCLAYLILPVDLIPSREYSILGWADEILSVEIVYDKMRKYLTEEMYSKAEEQLDKWIPGCISKNNTPVKTSNSNYSQYQQERFEFNKIVDKWKK